MALSGASALAYETVWLRQLGRAFGVTVYAVAGLVALYMGGLALGSAVAARRRAPADWMRAYGWLELGAGVCALAATWWLVRLPAVVAAWSPETPMPQAIRLLLAAPALLPPTLLLGATLPVLARDGADGALLYGANTLGALGGLCAAAFVSIGSFGEMETIRVACAVNLLAAASAFWLARRGEVRPAGAHPRRADLRSAVPFFVVSGFCALGCEVLWCREFVPLLGNSTYAFALVLAAYLAGLGLGSALRPESGAPPWEEFSGLLAALAAAIMLSLAAARFLALRLDSPDYLYSPLSTFADFPLVAAQALVLVGPTALVLGLLFPSAMRLVGKDGAAVGTLYAWNTVGGIAGSLLCGFIGVSTLGGHASILGLGLLAGLAAAAAAARCRGRIWAVCGSLLAAAAVAGTYARTDPLLDVLKARMAKAGKPDARALFYDESAAASVAGLEQGGGRTLYINGIEISGKGFLGDVMAVVPALASTEKPKSTLVICLGAGNTFWAASRLGGEVDVVELVDGVVRHLDSFQDDAADLLKKPGNRVFVEDGRQFLLRSTRRYDTIIVDAAPPLYSAGAVNLYTREFFELVRDHLTDGGAFLLWLPTRSFESDYWRIARGFCDAFPHASVWKIPHSVGFMVLGSRHALEWPKGELERRIEERAQTTFAWKHFDEQHLRALIFLSDAELRAYSARFEPLTDDQPAVEFPLARFWRGEPLMKTTEFLAKAKTRD